MLRILKGTGPGVIAIIIFTLLLLWIRPFADPGLAGMQVYETRPMPLYILLKTLMGETLLPGVICSFVMLALMLFLVVHFNTTLFFINQRTFLPAFIYLLLCSLFPQNQVLNPVLPAALLLILAMMRIMDSHRKQGTAYNFFDAGFLISTASLFYADMIWFGLLVIISILIIRAINLKEILLSVLGLLTPYLLVCGFYYVADRDLIVFLEDIRENLFGKTSSFHFSPEYIVSLIYSGVTIMIGTSFLMTRISTKKVRSSKTFLLLLWLLIISLLLYFAVPSVSVEMMWIGAIPASYLLAHYFVFARKVIIPEIIFSGLILMVLMVQLLDII